MTGFLEAATSFLSDWLWGYDFFVSYGHQDGSLDEGGQTRSRYVRTLVDGLRSGPDQFRVFHDETDYDLGTDIDAATRRRVRSSSKLLFVARPHAMESEWVRKEIDVAIKGTTDVVVVDINSTFAAAPASNPIKALIGDSRLRYAENLNDVDGSPSAELLDMLRLGSKRTRRDRRRRQVIIVVAGVLLALAGAALVFQQIASNQRTLRVVAQKSEQISRAVSLASAATSDIDDRSYLTARAMLATAVTLADSPSPRALLATATAHAPILTYANRLWESQPGGRSPSKPLAHRQLITLDSDHVLAVTPGGELFLIAPETGEVLRRSSVGAGWWTMAASSTTGLGILGSSEGRLVTFSVPDLRLVSEVETELEIRSVGVSDDGKTILVGSASGLYFRKSAELSQDAQEPITSHVYGVNAIATWGSIGTVWAAETRLFLTRPEPGLTDRLFSHSWAILSIACLEGTICFGGEDRVVYLETPRRKKRLIGHRGDVVDIAIGAEGRQVVSVSADGELIFWRPSAGVVLSRVRLPGKRITSVAIVEGTSDVLAMTDDGYLVKFGVGANILPDVLEGSEEVGAGTFREIFCFETHCLVIDDYGVVVRLEGPERPPEHLFRIDTGTGIGVADIDLCPDSSRFALQGNYASDITIHDAKSGKLVGRVPSGESRRVVWISDQALVTSSTSTGTLQVFEAREDEWRSTREVSLSEPRQGVTLIEVSPDRGSLAVAQEDGTLTVLSTRTWKVLARTEGAHGVSSLAVGRDARVAFANDGAAHVLIPGSTKADLGRGTLVAFSRSGGLLAVADENRYEIRILSVEGLRAVATLVGHEKPVWAMAFLGNGELVSGEFGGALRCWDLRPALASWKEDSAALQARIRRETGLSAALSGDRVVLTPAEVLGGQ